MSTFSGAPSRPRIAAPTVGLVALAVALVIVFAGNYHVPSGDNGGTGPGIVTGIICVLLAAGLFGYVVPRAKNVQRTALVLGVLGVVSILAFWSGVTPVFAGAALAVAARSENGVSRGTQIAVGLAGVASVVALVVTLAQSHF